MNLSGRDKARVDGIGSLSTRNSKTISKSDIRRTGELLKRLAIDELQILKDLARSLLHRGPIVKSYFLIRPQDSTLNVNY